MISSRHALTRRTVPLNIFASGSIMRQRPSTASSGSTMMIGVTVMFFIFLAAASDECGRRNRMCGANAEQQHSTTALRGLERGRNLKTIEELDLFKMGWGRSSVDRLTKPPKGTKAPKSAKQKERDRLKGGQKPDPTPPTRSPTLSNTTNFLPTSAPAVNTTEERPRPPPPGDKKKMKDEKLKKDKSKAKKGLKSEGKSKKCKGTTPTVTPISGPPSATATPTPSGPPSVRLSPYVLYYDINTTTIPLSTEVDEVVDVTADFLRDYFMKNVANLDDFTTDFIRSNFTLNQDYQIWYTSEAVFPEGTKNLPSKSELETLLAKAFMGDSLDEYISILQSLPDNVFNTVGSLDGEISGNNDSTVSQDTRGASTGGILSAAGAGMLLLAGMVYVSHKRLKLDPDGLGKHTKVQSQVTVAGYTYDATTTYRDASSVANETNAGETTLHSTGASDDGGNAITQRIMPCGQSVAENSLSQSEWGGTHAIPEHDSESDHDDDSTNPGCETGSLRFEQLENRQGDALEGPQISSPLEEIDEAASEISSDAESEDENVPMRVVDLIQRFSRR